MASVLLVHGVAQAAGVRASSELEERDGTKHPAEHAVDGLLQTAWAEDELGTGEGAWLQLDLPRSTEVASVSLWPGDLRRGKRSLKENGRPHTVTVELLDGSTVVASEQVRVRDGATQGMQRIDVPIAGQARAVKITIDQAYAGGLYNDTYLTEVAVNFAAGEPVDLGKVDAWIASSTGAKAVASHEAAVIERFDRIVTSDLGDREALDELLDWASDGAPYRRARVARDVAAGFRVQALPPDALAIEALLKLKDPNAVAALTRAALRSTGKEQARLERAVTAYEAFGDLKGGGRRNLPLWGTEGWEKGALRGFGEPLGIDLGADGKVYVADVANHRVSVFDDTGVVVRTIGVGEPTVTDAWFGKRRAHYVSGREPSEAPGGFTHPVDLDVVAGRDGDELVVLDGVGWVQWLGPDGEVRKRWRVRTEMSGAPGYGGVGFVRVIKRNVVVGWGPEVVVFDLEGTETGRWRIQEGAPIGVTVAKNGRLIFVFRSDAAEYGLDGFRFGTVMTSESLPLGYESWDLAVDERGKLWAVTDHGWLIAYKKPGKVDFQVRWSPVAQPAPRLIVRDGIAYLSAGGAVRKLDAVQQHLDEQAAAAESGDTP